MKVSERLDLVSLIGRTLQERYTFDDLFAYLAAFGVPQILDGPTNSKWSYTKAALASVPLETVLAIAKDLELDRPLSNDLNQGLPENWKGDSRFRLFISHISKDKLIATRLKEALEVHNISGFVAHEDIHPAQEWQNEIERALNSMHAMVAVHTAGFSESYWTQQEVGYALGRHVKIISFKMGEDPKGFISKHQALPRRNRKAEDIAAEIVALLKADARTKSALEAAQPKTRSFGLDDEIPF